MTLETGAPKVTLRNAPAAAVRRRHRRRPHLLRPARHHRRRDHRSAARHHRQADVRRRPPHRLPARDVRVRPRAGVAAVRVDGAAQLSVLQLRAAEPALREAGRAEGLRAADRRRGAGGVRARRGRSVGELRAAVGDPQGRHLRDPQAAAQHHTEGQPRSLEGAREGSREEGDRDGALRDPAGRVHGDGPHHLRHHAVSPDAHGAGLGHAARGARGDRRDGRGGAAARSRLHRSGRRRRPRRRRRRRARLPGAARRRRRLCRALRSQPGRQGRPPRRLVAERRGSGRRRRPRRLRRRRRRSDAPTTPSIACSIRPATRIGWTRSRWRITRR